MGELTNNTDYYCMRTALQVGCALGLMLLPSLVQAQDLQGTLALFNAMLNALIGMLITIAIIVFFWGLIKYLLTMGTENAHEAIHLMIWGVVAIFVMVSIWGIIRLLQNTFGVQGNKAIVPDTVKFQFGNN
jgi:uncharacterized protein YacL